jgi:mRNA interferase MazF
MVRRRGKLRPAVTVSSNAVDDFAVRRGRGVVTVVPVASSVSAVYPFQVLLARAETGLRLDSKARAKQFRSLATERLVRQLGTIPADRLALLDDALRLHLSL